MHKPSVGIVPEGLPAIGLTAVATLTCALLDWAPAAIICFAACAFSCHFFRNPERVVPDEPDVAVSPADGRILGVANKTEPISGEPRQCVSIFMNVLNVHVNRAPVAGTVTNIRYHEGTFLNAAWDKASTDNERCEYELRDDKGDRWVFVQIAGLVARRIVPWTQQGDALARGERFGMIRFGSRVDLYLPEGYTAVCSVGQNVFAGQSVIARKVENVVKEDSRPLDSSPLMETREGSEAEPFTEPMDGN